MRRRSWADRHSTAPCPLVTQLKPGELRVDPGNGKPPEHFMALSGGMIGYNRSGDRLADTGIRAADLDGRRPRRPNSAPKIPSQTGPPTSIWPRPRWNWPRLSHGCERSSACARNGDGRRTVIISAALTVASVRAVFFCPVGFGSREVGIEPYAGMQSGSKTAPSDQIIKPVQYVALTYTIEDQHGNVVEQHDMPLGFVYGSDTELIGGMWTGGGWQAGDQVEVRVSRNRAGDPDPTSPLPGFAGQCHRSFAGSVPRYLQKRQGRDQSRFFVTRIEDGQVTVDGNHPRRQGTDGAGDHHRGTTQAAPGGAGIRIHAGADAGACIDQLEAQTAMARRHPKE